MVCHNVSDRRRVVLLFTSSLELISSNTASSRCSRLIVVFSSCTSFGSSSFGKCFTARRSRCLDRNFRVILVISLPHSASLIKHLPRMFRRCHRW